MAKQHDPPDIQPDWHGMPTERMLEVLERRDFSKPTDEWNYAEDIATYLYYTRRRELRGAMLQRLHVLSQRPAPPQTGWQRFYRGITLTPHDAYLEASAQRQLVRILAALDGGAETLATLWRSPPAGWSTWGDTIELTHLLGELRVARRDIVEDLINQVEDLNLFPPRHAAMLALGRIGPAVAEDQAERAVSVIRAIIYDSSSDVSALRERVCERLSTAETDWCVCGACEHGIVPDFDQRRPSVKPCSTCIGIGYVRRVP